MFFCRTLTESISLISKLLITQNRVAVLGAEFDQVSPPITRLSHQGCQGLVHAEKINVWKVILGKHNLTAPITSYSRPEVFTKSQSYFLAQSVKTIAVHQQQMVQLQSRFSLVPSGIRYWHLINNLWNHAGHLTRQAEKEEGIIPLT